MLSLVSVFVAGSAWAGDRHEGVASCAGGTCHASTHPLGNSGIRQDEYFIWQQRDPHTRATAALGNAASQRIGQRLGIKPPTAPQCLACHADAVAEDQRGERFLASDGIGCEVCHGGAERWLAEHTQPELSLEKKAALGMTATWQPEVRAALCLSCHQGDAAHPITHAMMAAGHPPLLFELDTFTALQPPHHDRDGDYAQRKGVQDPARDWAVGQAVAAGSFLRELEGPRLADGLFPELVHFDCDACHHVMSAGRWLPGRSAGAAPGNPALADAHLYWLGVWLQESAPETAAAWRTRVAGLQSALRSGAPAVQAAARAARELLNRQIMPLAAERRLDTGQLKNLLRAIAATSDSARAHDFLAAEQAAMAALVIADALRGRGEPASAPERQAIDALYAAVRKRDSFAPQSYQAALRRLRQAVR